MASLPPPSAPTGQGVQPVFQGAAATASRRAALFLCVLIPIPTVMLFGQKAVWVVAFGCLPAGLGLAGLYFLLKHVDRLELDDSTGMIVPYIGRPISYTAVKALRFELDGTLTRVTCQASAFRSRPLLHAAGPEQSARLRQALTERCPEAEISNRSRSAMKAALLVVVLFAALHAGFLYYCRQKWPVVKVACERFDWPSGASAEPDRQYELGGIRYSIPVRFDPAVESTGAETRRYRDHAADQEIRVHSARLTDWLAAAARSVGAAGRQPGTFGSAYLGLLGIHSTYDLMRWPYCDRIGALPVILKAALIAPAAQPWDLKLYEIERGESSALIQVESSPGDYSAQILASSESGNREILFTVIAREAPGSGLIAALLRGFGFPAE